MVHVSADFQPALLNAFLAIALNHLPLVRGVPGLLLLVEAHGEDLLHLLADHRICSFVLLQRRNVLSRQRLLN